MKLSQAWRKHGARSLLGILLTLAAAVLCLAGNDTVARLDAMLGDWRMRAETPQLDRRIVIVDIDERSLAKVGRFPWSRDIQARLVRQLAGHYGVAALGFDIAFPEADTSSGYAVLQGLAQGELAGVAGLPAQLEKLRPAMDYDGLFAEAMRGQPVVLGYSVSEQQRKGVLPKPAFTVADLNGRTVTAYVARGYEANIAPLQAAAQGAGIFTALTDADGVVRSSTLLQRIGDGYYPSLSLATVAVYLQARAIAPRFTGTADTLSARELASGGLEHIMLFTPRGALAIPVGEALTTTVQYRGAGGPDGGGFRYVSASDVLAGTVPPALLKGAIVLVGTTAPGLNDIRATPVNAEYPGVEVHANLIKSMLDGRFKARPDYALALELVQILLFGLLLAGALAVLPPAGVMLATLGALAAAIGINLYLYATHDLVLGGAVLLLLIVALFIANLAWGYFFEVRKGRALVARFGEYVAPELVAEMADDPRRYTMEGENRELTVLFADVRGFTAISEQLAPAALREYINEYLTAMSEDIRDSHGGTLDKYIGDAVMAFWGAPVAFGDHASRAVASALLMQGSAARLNQQFCARGWPALRIGIGINTGPMHVGDMGSRIRRAYTVMGDSVNLAARLEGASKLYGVGIVVGEATRAAAPDFLYRELDRVRVVGKQEAVAIFEPRCPLAGAPAAELAQLERWHAVLASLRASDWAAAGAQLARLQADFPGDGLYRLYAARLEQYQSAPPPAGWDGVTELHSK
ncbi:CHASE2 domain-containing protein [Janthinobacterium sp. NKUCC08_JDC]|uniref:CHASE2 domain-containing protein n=1 Tax=Janthinobacterium sp. NKUCC08_JDC TaxID=2842122 RepID=UPI001C5A78DB|nr:adenylate/guanylate cyclase domain-containing protein [Janthinobacterium sp. NKUCC08_JDC]MBW3497666.1 adenylate/guanylate cyclase domain-containing protein [Janthinobacterium sp. NKUCC08_JDC]